jgi:hypothetical protein
LSPYISLLDSDGSIRPIFLCWKEQKEIDMERDTERGDSPTNTILLVLGVVAVIGVGVLVFRDGDVDETMVMPSSTTTQQAPAGQTETAPTAPQSSGTPVNPPAEPPATP